MRHLSSFNLFQESRGVADATLYLIEPICKDVFDLSMEFKDEAIDEDEYTSELKLDFDYDSLKKYIPKKSVYAWFPVSQINLSLKLIKDTTSKHDFKFMVGGWASHFGKKKDKVSRFKRGVKKNPDHSISLDMGIDVHIGGLFDASNEKDINDFKTKLESVVLHELNHLYEYYHRTWDPYKRDIQTSITWASIGDIPEGELKEITKYWQDEFTYYIYQSEPHEIRAQIQEAKSYVDRLSVEELKNTSLWKNIKKMQNFDVDKFMNEFHTKALSMNLIEEDILRKLITTWKKDYKKLYKEQTEKNNPSPDFFKRMSDAQFMDYWGRKIKEAGDKMVRGVLRQYANKI